MSRLFQALLSGMFFTFIIDFFLFLGIKQNYIDFYGVHVYYNILFADHQNLFVFFFFSFIIGYLVIYANTKTALIAIGLLFLLSFLTLIPPIGKALGEMILMKKNVMLTTDKFSYHGDIYYNGRKTITFYDYDLKKVLNLDKNKIKGQY
ncbi:MAG TPA: hypothetical protein EYG74_02585 [Sulfurimonas autotrophica]|nr:hypothetical protein [Sulfurimonas autotrophica]